MVLKKIEVVDYDKQWQEKFSEIKKCLRKTFPNLPIIHVGSTSIPNLPAKPIIDIDIVIKDINELPKINEKLKTLGYEFLGDLGIIGRYAYSYSNLPLYPHHLYVCLNDGRGYIEHRIFQKYLLKYPYDLDSYVHGQN